MRSMGLSNVPLARQGYTHEDNRGVKLSCTDGQPYQSTRTLLGLGNRLPACKLTHLHRCRCRSPKSSCVRAAGTLGCHLQHTLRKPLLHKPLASVAILANAHGPVSQCARASSWSASPKRSASLRRPSVLQAHVTGRRGTCDPQQRKQHLQ